VIAAVAIAIAGLTGLPAGAHSFTKNDGNDSPGKLDLRSVSVGHTKTGVVHTFRTYEPWTAKSLGADSYFLVQIDKDNLPNDATRYERCAFIYFDARLRGLLSNCRAQFIRFLPVVKLSGTAAKVTVPKTQTGNAYWWAGVSIWDGPAPCGKGCVDFSPNLFPDLLHDLTPPVVTMPTTDPLRTWVDSVTAGFVFPFTVDDAHSGIDTWRVQRRTFESTTWVTIASGTGGGPKSPTITGVPGHSMYRVVAFDEHGNQKVGPTRRVFVPRDDDELGPQGVYADPTPAQQFDDTAFGGTYTTLGSGESLTYNYVQTAGACRPFELIGPGGGDWTVDVTVNGVPFSTIDGLVTPAGPRQVLFSHSICDSTEFVFEVTDDTGAEFPVDGVVAKAS
jgi:hypothetical protein